MRTFIEYIREEQPDRPPVDPTERHRRMSRGGRHVGNLSNRIIKVGDGEDRKEVQVGIILPPETDPDKKRK